LREWSNGHIQVVLDPVLRGSSPLVRNFFVSHPIAGLSLSKTNAAYDS
jgi:hypothetical protein